MTQLAPGVAGLDAFLAANEDPLDSVGNTNVQAVQEPEDAEPIADVRVRKADLRRVRAESRRRSAEWQSGLMG